MNTKKSRSQILNGASYDNTFILDGVQLPTAKLKSSLQSGIRAYEKIISSLAFDLSESSRATINVDLSHIRRQLQADIPGLEISSDASPCVTSPNGFLSRASFSNGTNSQRYLGEASDVRFFHAIKKIFENGAQDSPTDSDIQSYDQGVLHLDTQDRHQTGADIPTKELADAYIEIYFFTIHIAYPFVNKNLFLEKYGKFWAGDREVAESSSWFSLFCKHK